MGKTGWTIKDFINSSNHLYETDKMLEESPLMRRHNDIQDTRREMLKEFAQRGDIEELLFVERFMLERDLELYARKSASKKEKESIETALKQLADAEKSLKIVHEPDKYKHAAETYSYRQKTGGLPEDAFRQFVSSHKVRLANWLSDRSLESDKGILTQRRGNMDAVLKHYTDLQLRALA